MAQDIMAQIYMAKDVVPFKGSPPVDVWQYKSCKAEVGVGDSWATVYLMNSKEPCKGHGAILLFAMKKYYEAKGLFFGGSVALNGRMKRLYLKCQVHEYC